MREGSVISSLVLIISNYASLSGSQLSEVQGVLDRRGKEEQVK